MSTHVDNLHSEIAAALNRHSAEMDSNTPDFILAKFLLGCLQAWDNSVRERERWYGRDPNTGPAGTISTLGPAAPVAPREEPFTREQVESQADRYYALLSPSANPQSVQQVVDMLRAYAATLPTSPSPTKE